MKTKILALAFLLAAFSFPVTAQETGAKPGDPATASPETTTLPGDMPADQSDMPYDADAENWKTLHGDEHHDREDYSWKDRRDTPKEDPNAVYNDPAAGGPQNYQAGAAPGIPSSDAANSVPHVPGTPPANVRSGMHPPALGAKMGGAGEVARKIQQQQDDQ